MKRWEQDSGYGRPVFDPFQPLVRTDFPENELKNETFSGSAIQKRYKTDTDFAQKGLQKKSCENQRLERTRFESVLCVAMKQFETKTICGETWK